MTEGVVNTFVHVVLSAFYSNCLNFNPFSLYRSTAEWVNEGVGGRVEQVAQDEGQVVD